MEALALLCVSYLLLLLCRRETHGSLSDLLNISLCFLKMATKCFCFSRSVCVNIYVCVCLSEGSAVLVRYRRSWILSESAAGGEDGALGQVPVH